MKTNSTQVGLLFAFAAALAIGGPMILGRAGEETYVVPEPTVLSADDTRLIDDQVTKLCAANPPLRAEPTLPSGGPAQEVPVVLFHRITNSDKPSHEVTRPKLFKEQMDWLKADGYETISVDQLQNYMAGKGTIPKKPIVISFDDGWKDNIEAAKYLTKLDLGATFYIVSGFFNAPQYMTQGDVIKLSKNPKFEIGSHSHSHFVRHIQMSKVDLCTFSKELATSKMLLERIIEKPITSFAWPYGYNTKEAVHAAASLGYISTLHVNQDSHNSPGYSPLFIRRMNIDGNCTLEDFQKMVETKVLKECSPRTLSLPRSSR